MDEAPKSDNWHELLDAICLEKGHTDNANLARDFCAQTGAQGEAAFDAALKSLANWRRGQHLPHRRNFNALTQILDIADDAQRLQQWNTLYSAAKSAPKNEPEDTPDAGQVNPGTPSQSRGLWHSPIIGAAVAAIILAVGYSVYQSVAEDQTASIPPGMVISENPIDMTDKRIYWREETRLRVGEHAVIHGKRGRCGVQPPPWEDVLKNLPEMPTGVWLDGGVGYRVSRSCGGSTPARAILFRATVPGTVNFMLFDDPISIIVE